MKHVLRTLLVCLVALFLVDQLCTAILNIARAQRLAGLAHGAWWPSGFAAFETLEFLVYGAVFGALGAAIARLFQHKFIALALVIGCLYSALAFAVEPDMPFARYSHAPAWLWVLSWSVFYVPPIASALGAMTAGLLIGRHGRANAA